MPERSVDRVPVGEDDLVKAVLRLERVVDELERDRDELFAVCGLTKARLAGSAPREAQEQQPEELALVEEFEDATQRVVFAEVNWLSDETKAERRERKAAARSALLAALRSPSRGATQQKEELSEEGLTDREKFIAAKVFGALVRTLRTDAGLSLREAAAARGLTPTQFGIIERGAPSWTDLASILVCPGPTPPAQQANPAEPALETEPSAWLEETWDGRGNWDQPRVTLYKPPVVSPIYRVTPLYRRLSAPSTQAESSVPSGVHRAGPEGEKPE